MKCPRCQQETPSDADFCPECGAKLFAVCPQCGTANAPTHNFCKKCGQPRAAALAQEGGAATASSPQSYTPKHLAEKILTSRSAVEGERKHVTVLFADLKGSMELLADRDPEEARRLLDPVLERLMEAVHRYEGTVNQVLGDGIMAIFGAPLAHEDHAVRGCYAALRMQESVRRFWEETQRPSGISVQIRVGLNSGEVVVGSIGSDLRMDYTAVGQTTHLAARMEQMARPGSVLLTANTLQLAEGYIEVAPLGPVPVKGLAVPVEAYELIRAAPLQSRLQAAAGHSRSPFVGRGVEVEQLRRAIEQARVGHGHLAAIVGEPGVGKSRLVAEFARSYRNHGWLILESSSVSYEQSTPYLSVIDLLKSYVQVEDSDGAGRVREKVTGKLLALDDRLKEAIPAILFVLGVLPDDDPFRSLDPPERRSRMLDALKRLVLRESQRQPALLVFENLHWIDSETQAFLNTLVDSLPAAHILLLVTYRPEYQHGWSSKTYYTQLQLDPLPSSSANELLQALVGGDARLEPLRQLLIERTEGNPFFIEESVRALIETKILVGERAYRLAKPLESVQVPVTVQAVLAARIDRLAPKAKHVLQSAAVIGKDVPLTLLQTIVELPEDELRGALTTLQAAEFLYETSLFAEPEFTFKHALTHEVAYGTLLRERRRALHGAIVAAIERLAPQRLADQVERLAHHAARGAVWDKAVTYFRQAGEKAISRSANREAVASFEEALAALERLPQNREAQAQAIDLRFDLRNALLPFGELGQMFDYLREAEVLAETLGDRRRLGRVSAYMTQYLCWIGNHDQAIESGRRALALADALPDVPLQIMANLLLGQVYQATGDYRQAIGFFRKNLAVLDPGLFRERFGLAALPSVQSLALLSWCLGELGEFAEGIGCGQEGVRLAESVERPRDLILACRGLGALHLRQGDLQEGVAILERGLALCRSANIRTLFPTLAAHVGYGYALSGRIAVAVPLLEEAVNEVASTKIVYGYSLLVAWLGEACLLAGRMEEAIQHASRALELSRAHKERGHEAWTLRLLGDISAHRETALKAAEEHYRQAMALAEELRMRPLLAHCHLGLGTWCRRAGTRPGARAHLDAAAGLFRDLNMRLWLEKADVELKELA